MKNWTSGYMADIAYTYGYYTELNPLRIKLAFISQGLEYPEVGTACELGFGQGVSTNLHAAASVVSWSGTDFHPGQAACAQEFADVSGSKAKLYDDSFEELAAREDLPEFDYIAMHGIWSWISDHNRSVIVDFIKRKLKVGGVLYISYNTLPGWAPFAPMRHLMTKHADIIGADGSGIVSNIGGAIEFAEKLLDTNPGYARANPQIGERLKSLKTQNPHYLAHEYFNSDWHPMHFTTMADWLESAKLTFAGSAHFLDHVDALNLTKEQQEFLNEIPDIMFREAVRDFMINQQFRRDYWVKGARQLSKLEQAERIRELRFILAVPRDDVPMKVKGSLGEANMTENIYTPILDAMESNRIHTLGELEQAVEASRVTFAQLLQAILVLSSQGSVAIVNEENVIKQSVKQSQNINRYLINKARSNGDIGFLASPVTGGGISVGRFNQLFLLGVLQGKKEPAELAETAWQILAMQGQKIVSEGKAIESPEDNLAELTRQATVFKDKMLPVIRALKIF